jgi:hypothetical protein
MLTLKAPAGHVLYSSSFTIPGPILEKEESKALWADFCRVIERADGGMVWRVELQERKQAHWHTLILLPEGFDGRPGRASNAVWEIDQMWHKMLHDLPVLPSYMTRRLDGEFREYVNIHREQLPGARVRSARTQKCDNDGAWLRYLNDHTTKAKQSQIAYGWGRHWGIVGRKRFEVVQGNDVGDLGDSFPVILRFMRRLFTPCVNFNPKKHKREVPFGHCLGYPPRRGWAGASVWFSEQSKTSGVVRLVDWCGSAAKVPRSSFLECSQKWSAT